MTSNSLDAFPSTGPVLAFLQGLLEEGKPSSLADIVEGLVSVFGADGGGLLYPLKGPAQLSQSSWITTPIDGFPWEKDELLLDRVKQSGSCVECAGPGDARWLLTSLGSTGLNGILWIACCDQRTWSGGETAAFALAAGCLARHLATHPDAADWMKAVRSAQLQENIERTAAVTTRLAHDFGNVLTGILGFAELALPHTKTDSLPHRYLTEVLNSARQGASWIQKLQCFSRRFRPRCVPTSLATLLKEEQCRAHWQGAIEFRPNAPADLPNVAIDTDSLRQVLQAFFDNAREAIAAAGYVSVAAQTVSLSAAQCLELLGNNRPGPHVELTIRDSGTGIAPQVQERLFREFFASSKGKRRGLGLAVVYGILHCFQAGFRLRSTPGQGTTVQVYLPTGVASAPAPRPAAGSPPGPARILVVDDDPLVLRSLSCTLAGAGYRVRTAPGPQEALVQVAQAEEPFQLVLTDVVMPECNGLEMARRMLNRDPRTNFLFISSQTHQDPLLVRFPFLSKPFEAPALLRVVGAALADVARPGPLRSP